MTAPPGLVISGRATVGSRASLIRTPLPCRRAPRTARSRSSAPGRARRAARRRPARREKRTSIRSRATTDTPSGRLASRALERLDRQRPRPGSRSAAPSGSLGQEPLPACCFAAEGGPPPVFPELAEELCSRERSLVAGELGPEGLHERRRPGSRDAEELLDVAAREHLAVQRRELADGVGDGEEPPGRGRASGSAVSATPPAARARWDDVWRASCALG